MAYPQGYLYQPSASLALYSCPAYGAGVLSGPRTEELGRSPAGSAFAPYAGSTAFASPSPGYSAPVQYGADTTAAAATFTPYVGSPYDHTTGMSGSIGYHPYGAPLGSYPYGDPAYRKNATRDATATLKAWLSEHRKNPYPTKGEKIMLAIITKMTLTQVSTWFANARRRLKKENKMTWTPRNRSEDEEEDENLDPEKREEHEEREGKGDSTDTESAEHKLHAQDIITCGRFKEENPAKDTEPLVLTDSELKAHEDGTAPSPEAPPAGPELTARETSVIRTRTCAPKPKLWSLAEIATSSSSSSDGCKGGGSGDGSVTGQSTVITAVRAPSPPGSPPRCPFPSTVLSRPVYYASHFYPAGYTNYGAFGHVHGPGHGPGDPHFTGIPQTVRGRAETPGREGKVRTLDHCKGSPYELKTAQRSGAPERHCADTSVRLKRAEAGEQRLLTPGDPA
ncbi:hypothetical protein AAFF_G00293690 [Aldrovandia affinis]|uniref:Homeobox domain-containing protein n=1 Tax=Aldrovandia affinis TaxID=143900 RepID=A0AAD7R932_9TELE|nr:hypothetical protein AAFF_G00293690 [Aldrovandia affinis]